MSRLRPVQLRVPLSRFDALPRWAKPPLVGGALLFVIVAGRMVLAFPILFGNAALRAQALVVLAGATAAGMAGGLAYSFIGRPLLRVPRIGRYLTGIVCVAAYLTPLLLWSPHIFGDEHPIDLHDPGGVVIVVGCVLLFGIVMGHSWFEAPRRTDEHRDRAS